MWWLTNVCQLDISVMLLMKCFKILTNIFIYGSCRKNIVFYFRLPKILFNNLKNTLNSENSILTEGWILFFRIFWLPKIYFQTLRRTPISKIVLLQLFNQSGTFYQVCYYNHWRHCHVCQYTMIVINSFKIPVFFKLQLIFVKKWSTFKLFILHIIP